MRKHDIFVCPHCRTFHSIRRSFSTPNCDECGFKLVLVNFDHETYMSFSEDQKTAFKNNYIRENFLCTPFKPMRQSRLVSCVGCFGISFIILGTAAGFFTAIATGFQAGVSLLIGAPISGCVLILLSIVAEDVRHIRNRADELHHAIETEKYKRTV